MVSFMHFSMTTMLPEVVLTALSIISIMVLVYRSLWFQINQFQHRGYLLIFASARCA